MKRMSASSSWIAAATAAAALIVAGPAVGGNSNDESGGQPDLSGTWQLDAKRSDSPEAKAREQMRSRGGGPGGPGGGSSGPERGGGPPSSGGGGQRGGEDKGKRGMEELRRMEEAARELAIWQQATLLTFHDAADFEWQVEPGGGEREAVDPQGRRARVTAEWKRGGRLRMSWRGDQGQTRTETYELVAEGQTLLVQVRLEGQGRPALEYQRVYRRANPSSQEPATGGGDQGSPSR